MFKIESRDYNIKMIFMYKVSDFFLMRNPVNSLQRLEHYNELDALNNWDFEQIIFKASPSLHKDYIRLKNGAILSPKKHRKFSLALYKYFSRSCTRCTPFENVSTYTWSELAKDGSDTICLSKENEYKIRWHYDFLKFVFETVSKNAPFPKQLKYYKNPTLFDAGDNVHYVEYDNQDRMYRFSQICNSKVIQNVLDLSEELNDFETLKMLVCKDTPYTADATEVLLELISNQVFLSEFQIVSIGEDRLKLYTELANESLNIDFTFLSNLVQLDNDKGLTSYEYAALNNLVHASLKENSLEYSGHDFFSINIKKNINHGNLSNTIKSDLFRFLEFYEKNCSRNRNRNRNIDEFTEVFEKRYGEGNAVDLLEALDPYTGIGYPYGKALLTPNELLKGLDLPKENSVDSLPTLTELEKVVIKRLVSSENNIDCITLCEDDFTDSSHTNSCLPVSFSIMLEAFENNTYFFKGMSNKTLTSSLTRYVDTDSEICQFVNEAGAYEYQMLGEDKIVSEIVHKTNSKLDNIFSFSSKRKSKLVCFNDTNYSAEYDDCISNLSISCIGGVLRLWSKKHKKYIHPVDSTVYNNSTDDFSFFRFLSDFGYQESLDTFLNFDMLFTLLDYIPRLMYDNFIILPATWKLTMREFEQLKKYVSLEKDSFTMGEILNWAKNANLPSRVVYYDNDRALIVDWSNQISVQSFIQTAKPFEKEYVWVSEFLYDQYESLIHSDAKRTYANEIILFCNQINNHG